MEFYAYVLCEVPQVYTFEVVRVWRKLWLVIRTSLV